METVKLMRGYLSWISRSPKIFLEPRLTNMNICTAQTETKQFLETSEQNLFTFLIKIASITL